MKRGWPQRPPGTCSPAPRPTPHAPHPTPHAPHPTPHAPRPTLHAPRPTPHAPRPLAPAGNWVRFSCSIPRLFVLSHNMPMINTTGKLGSFWRFSITAGSLRSDSLATILSLHASRSMPHAPPAGTGRARTLPAGCCLPPTVKLSKTERDPISTSGPSILSMSPNQAIPTEKSIRFPHSPLPDR